MYWSLYQFFPRTTFRTGSPINPPDMLNYGCHFTAPPPLACLPRARPFFLSPTTSKRLLRRLGMISNDSEVQNTNVFRPRVSRLVNQSTITWIISDKSGSSWRLLPPNGLYKAWSWHAFIIATVFSMVYQLCIFPNCNVFDSEFRSATLSPIHPGTVILTQCCLHCIGYWWSSELAIKSLWSLSRLFTILGLRI